MRHTAELHVSGWAARKPFLGEFVNVGGLAERDRGTLPGYLNVEEIRDLALILYFPALRELVREGGVKRVGAVLEVQDEEVVDVAPHAPRIARHLR